MRERLLLAAAVATVLAFGITAAVYYELGRLDRALASIGR